VCYVFVITTRLTFTWFINPINQILFIMRTPKILLTTLLFVIVLSIQAQWQGTGPIFYNGGNVGIGTSTPDSKLLVMGKKALKAVHDLICHGKKLVFDGAAGQTLAKFLDDLEYLPALMLEKSDRTDIFEDFLKKFVWIMIAVI
jgi:hypothetical protein